jgi:hypothetical protein
LERGWGMMRQMILVNRIKKMFEVWGEDIQILEERKNDDYLVIKSRHSTIRIERWGDNLRKVILTFNDDTLPHIAVVLAQNLEKLLEDPYELGIYVCTKDRDSFVLTPVSLAKEVARKNEIEDDLIRKGKLIRFEKYTRSGWR